MIFFSNLSKTALAIAATTLTMAFTGPATAQGSGSQPMNGMGSMPGMDMPGARADKSKPATPPDPAKATGNDAPMPKGQAAPESKGMDHGQMKNDSSMRMPNTGDPGMKDMQGMGMQKDSMGEMKMGPMQGGSPPPDARDPDAHAEGTPVMAMRGMEMADDARYGRVLVNELEYANGNGERGQNLNVEAWYGGDYNKLWLKAEGKRRQGRLESFRTEALWDRAISTFWSSQLGVRHDNGGGPTRNWLALGVQGLAPYWFETEATAYIGRNGSLAARVEVRYELLFTQKLILEPKFEANFYSKNDPERRIGSGLSDLDFGLRLRYEISREVAPYIGVTWDRKVGNTANYARQSGERVRSTQLVAGVRLWF